jgi:hypothetical protein
MPDPLLGPHPAFWALHNAFKVAVYRAHVRGVRQRVACIPLSDDRRTYGFVRYVVTDA